MADVVSGTITEINATAKIVTVTSTGDVAAPKGSKGIGVQDQAPVIFLELQHRFENGRVCPLDSSDNPLPVCDRGNTLLRPQPRNRSLG